MGPSGIDIFQMIHGAGPVVKLVLFMLFFFSVASWAIILIKFWYIRNAFKESDYFIDVFWESRDFDVAFEEAEEFDGSPIARIFCIGYNELKKLGHREPGNNGSESLQGRFAGIDNVKRAMRRAINVEITRMTHMVPFLATTGNTAPFIGLFGTVWGIMNTFHAIGKAQSASLAAVGPGISEALVATAAGLAVAIPAVIAFNHFMQKIRVFDSELQSFYADFLNIIEREIIGGAKGNK